MKLMSSKIYLRNVRFHAFHGVLPQEGIVGNDYLVNLVLDYDFSSAMQTDDLQGTLNYAEVYQKVREEMAVPSKLLEHVAGRIAYRLFSDFPEIQKLQLSIYTSQTNGSRTAKSRFPLPASYTRSSSAQQMRCWYTTSVF